MNLLPTSTLLLALNAVLILGIAGLWLTSPAKRNQQWIVKSFFLGLGIAPLIVSMVNGLKWVDQVTLAAGDASLVELAVFSGLAWATAASWLLSLRFAPAAVVAVTINWAKVAGFYLVLLGSLWVANVTKINAALALITTVGLISIILAARQPRLLGYSAMSGLLASLLSLIIAYGATFFTPQLAHVTTIPVLNVPVAVSPTICIVLGALALSSPIVSRWWFNQPLSTNAR